MQAVRPHNDVHRNAIFLPQMLDDIKKMLRAAADKPRANGDALGRE